MNKKNIEVHPPQTIFSSTVQIHTKNRSTNPGIRAWLPTLYKKLAIKVKTQWPKSYSYEKQLWMNLFVIKLLSCSYRPISIVCRGIFLSSSYV